MNYENISVTCTSSQFIMFSKGLSKQYQHKAAAMSIPYVLNINNAECVPLTRRVDSRLRSKPRVFINTFVSGSDSRRNSCSVPKQRTISPFTFWSAWNAMFLTHKHTFCIEIIFGDNSFAGQRKKRRQRRWKGEDSMLHYIRIVTVLESKDSTHCPGFHWS